MNSGFERQPRPHVAVVGAGAWGTTLALVSLRAGNPTTLVVRSCEAFASFHKERRHPRSLPGIEIPAVLEISDDPVVTITAADIVILAIPTQKLRSAIGPVVDALLGKVVVSAAKGLEVSTLMRPSQIVSDVFGDGNAKAICALSGPNLSTEVAIGKPATTVVASSDPEAAAFVQTALMSEAFRVYTSDDVVGVEIGGALKNIIAIGAGIGDGLGAGDNAKAAFLTRGIAEIARLGVAHGAQPLTFAGLTGIGDLIATCASPLSRNHQVGIGLASGKSLNDVLAGMTEVAEGVDTTRAAIRLARRSGTELPIAEQLYAVLFEQKSPLDAVRDLMIREPTGELRGML
jgi:glycerol-3-phosphate dehydrogenase (NAD(P)+)